MTVEEINKEIKALKNNEGSVSDGYHTFDELYYYRMLYNALWINTMSEAQKKAFNVHKSKRHNDGEECFGGGWFIIIVDLPTGQVSNHYELQDWDKFACEERERADKWDGHTPQQAAGRMVRYVNRQTN